MISKLRNIKAQIIKLLTDKPHLRDDDNKLIANIWHSEMRRRGEKSPAVIPQTAFEFLEQLANGEYTSPEAIRRARQKIQEQNVHLQGELYSQRKKKSKIVKHHIHSV